MIPTLQKTLPHQYIKKTREKHNLVRRALLSGAAAGAGFAVLSAAGALAARALAAGETAGTLEARHITVRLNGDIVPACALLDASGSGNQALFLNMSPGDITKPGTREFSFMVDCNAPFEYRLDVRNGALTHQDGVSARAGFTSAIPYHVAVHIPTSGAPIDDQCEGEDLRAGETQCQFSNSGDAIALKTTGRLTFAWAPNGTPLAGRYSEQMTIRVSARP
jgi:hypothetical protein